MTSSSITIGTQLAVAWFLVATLTGSCSATKCYSCSSQGKWFNPITCAQDTCIGRCVTKVTVDNHVVTSEDRSCSLVCVPSYLSPGGDGIDFYCCDNDLCNGINTESGATSVVISYYRLILALCPVAYTLLVNS